MAHRDSNTDIAYRLMLKKKKERNFYDIWNDVKKELAKILTPEEMENIDEDISFFYTNLTLDGRFVNVGDNKFNLRERVKFENVHIDMNEIYAEEEVDSEEEANENNEEVDEESNFDSFDDEDDEAKAFANSETSDFDDEDDM